MRRHVSRPFTVLVAVSLVTLLSWQPASASGPPKRPLVEVRGTAYVFNVGRPIVGATIRIAERPSVSATTGDDGSYVLEVPRGAVVTPYIEAAGHHTIYLQTFRVPAEGLREVNFQTPTDGVYDALRAYLAAVLDIDPTASGCTVVTTVSDPRVVGMTFDEFIHFHPHGVAGATAWGSPDMGRPVYFNESVLPDPTWTHTSNDGGVIWLNVPEGTYRVRASLPGMRFASFTATCVEGRLINANPPWGLHGR